MDNNMPMPPGQNRSNDSRPPQDGPKPPKNNGSNDSRPPQGTPPGMPPGNPNMSFPEFNHQGYDPMFS